MPQETIKSKLEKMQRLRASSISRLFTSEELTFASTFPGDTVKEQVLRASGQGACRHCGGLAPYQGKMSFQTYCSQGCQTARKSSGLQIVREEKHLLIQNQLSLLGIHWDNPEEFVNVRSVIRAQCTRCGVQVPQTLRSALKHVCKEQKLAPPVRPKKPKVMKPKVMKPKQQKVERINACVECGTARHKKSRPGRCKACHSAHVKNETFRLNLGILPSQYVVKEAFPSEKRVTVMNNECGHEFTANISNLLGGFTLCQVCGPQQRIQAAMTGYMKKYSRSYDLAEYESYSTLVRNCSTKNWVSEHGEIEGRGHSGVHLDHKVPIIYGFKNRIAPHVMADLINLQLLSYKENLAKGGRVVDYSALAALTAKYSDLEWNKPCIGTVGAVSEGAIDLLSRDVTKDVIEYPNTSLFIVRHRAFSFGELPLDDHPNYMIVFEDELFDHRRRVIESMLNYAAGRATKVYARKCEVREVSSVDAVRFMHSNHLSGQIKSSVRLGLYLDGILQCLMLFSKARFDRSHQYELVRYANRLDTSVVGGASKLFKEFIKRYNPESIMTYADRRLGKGGALYETLGMTKIRTTPHSLWWVKDGNRINRQDVRPGKIEALLGQSYNENLPVEHNMRRAGWISIHDLGSNVYSWKPSQI